MQIYLALGQYADENQGRFPAGEETPEASLSLLYKRGGKAEGFLEALRGKSVSLDVVRNRLHNGQLLSPETCGWVYVEGLMSDDPAALAILWDKAGLDHNGRRLLTGGHLVVFRDGQTRHVSAINWPQFEAEQRRLREDNKAKRDLWQKAK